MRRQPLAWRRLPCYGSKRNRALGKPRREMSSGVTFVLKCAASAGGKSSMNCSELGNARADGGGEPAEQACSYSARGPTPLAHPEPSSVLRINTSSPRWIYRSLAELKLVG